MYCTSRPIRNVEVATKKTLSFHQNLDDFRQSDSCVWLVNMNYEYVSSDNVHGDVALTWSVKYDVSMASLVVTEGE